MTILGIEFNDAALLGVADGEVVFAEPGCALVSDGTIVFGDAAQRLARATPRGFYDRYWRDLSEEPVATGIVGLESCADLAHAQLANLWKSAPAGTSGAAYAIPSYWSREQLALLLGISEELQIPVEGIVEIPVAVSRRPYPDHQLIHVQVYSHATTLSRMSQENGASVIDTDVIDSVGMKSLQRSCADYFARCFLEHSRFDPMYDARSEQRIYDLSAEWLEQLAKAGSVDLSFTHEGTEFSAQATAGQLADSLRLRCQPLLQALRSHIGAGQATVLQIDPRLATFPAVAEGLQELPDCVVYALEAAAAARGIEARHSQLGSQDGGFALTASLAWDQAPVDLDASRTNGSGKARVPTHLAFADTAYRLGSTPLRIGAEAASGEYGLLVAAPHNGISRRHCSVELDAGRAILHDHSRYGTQLNGHRVEGSAVLQTGDVISIGDPACELRLITETESDGA